MSSTFFAFPHFFWQNPLGSERLHANVYQNPVSFLGSNWNRTADLWEIGQLTNFRLSHREFSNGINVTDVELIAFPGQYFGGNKLINAFFAGYERISNSTSSDENIAIMGLSKILGKLRVSGIAKHNFRTDEQEVIFGIVVSLPAFL